jgi:integrase
VDAAGKSIDVDDVLVVIAHPFGDVEVPLTDWIVTGGSCARVGDDALRVGLAEAAARHLPKWTDALTPHVLRHFCASQLYQGGLDLVSIQEVLGHSWIATTMHYINPREMHQTGENPLVAC